MAPVERPRPFVPVLLAWLVPGLGHLKLGRVWPAAFVFLGVVPLFVLGLTLAGFENVSWERHQFYFALHAWCGLPALAASFATQDAKITEVLRHYDVGTLYSAVAGLLNLVAITDVWARCRRGDPEELARRLEAAQEEDPLAAQKLVDGVDPAPAVQGGADA